MVEVTIKSWQQGRYYFPKHLQNILGAEAKATPNQVAVAVYSKDADKDDVIRSLAIIIEDLKHQKQLEAKELRENKNKRSRNG